MAANAEPVLSNEVTSKAKQLIPGGTSSNAMLSTTSGNHIPFKLIETSDRVWIDLLQNPEIFGDNNNYIRGYVNKPAELESILEAHKRATTSSYSVRTSNSKKDKAGAWKKNIQPVFCRNWEPKMEFDCTPFIVVKVTYMECEFGRDYWRKDKKQQDDHNYHNIPEDATLKPEPVTGSRKRGCLARLTVWEVLIFTEYRIANCSDMVAHHLREMKSKRLEDLRKRLHNNEQVPYDTRFFLELPFKSAHRNHNQVVDGLQLRVHRKIIDCIHQHVQNGTTNREKIKSLIDTFVQQELSSCGVEPNPLDRSYHPTDRDVANHIYRAINIEKYKRIDHDAIMQTVSTLKKSTSGLRIMYQPTEKTSHRPKETVDDDSSFMLVYQEGWQALLMKNRLKTICVMDSTYRNLNYPLPLYTLWIYVDEKFICVAIIFIQSDSTEELAQALCQLKCWNPDWQPEIFLLDAQQPCWKAVEQTFPKSKVFISTFHCNQAWSQFLNSKKLNLSESSRLHIFSLLQRAANSSSKEGYTEVIDMIKTTQEWKSSDYLRYVINRFWFHNSSKWAMSSQPEELLMTISGTAQDKLKYALEYSYLPHIWDKTVSAVLETFSGKFFPELIRTDGRLELINMDSESVDMEENETSIDKDTDADYEEDDLSSSPSSDAKLPKLKKEIRKLCKDIEVMSQNCSRKTSLIRVLKSLKTFKKDLVMEITEDFHDSQKRSRRKQSKIRKAQKRLESENPQTSVIFGSNDDIINSRNHVLLSDSMHTAVYNDGVHMVSIDDADGHYEVPGVAEAVEISP